METSVSASTLSRHRLSVAVLSLAATATLGYFCYRVYSPPLPEPDPDRVIRRSNAVRHRRRSLPTLAHSHGHGSDDHEQSHGPGHAREPSEASTTSVESQADENVDVNTVRPLNDAETVADEHVLEDNWYDDGSNQFAGQQQRAGQNIVELLFRVSEDNARRNAFVHRGCMCNGCGVSPIRGIRYRCANCIDFDLCETCESQGLHTKTHVFYKIKVPIPRLGARQPQPVWYPGEPEDCLRLLPKHLMAKLSKETGFERPELEALWEQWTYMASTEWREDPDELCLAMNRKTFERYLVPSGGYRHIAPNLLHDRMFAFYDDNNDDLIGFAEFLRGTAYRKRKDRLRKVFNGYDIDGDGYISRRDCLRLFRAYYVVFKHMHSDILDGLDDQLMSSTEAQKLVNSRQPLSSFFGREGGLPDADTDRPLESKIMNITTGRVHVTEGGNRAVNEDAPDTADRQSFLAGYYAEEAHAMNTQHVPNDDRNLDRAQTSALEYLSGLLNPPSQISELPALLMGASRDGDDFLIVVNRGDGEDGGARVYAEGSASGAAGSARGVGAGSSERDVRQRLFMGGPGRQARANARRKLFERWKRRQFYVDEEEGVPPPEDWSDEDDILATVNISDESKSAQPPLSSRSRSSSKVRFAEDTDDFDIRSNPSTSSRSIPERWGGMEIPDAERDAGKEVFYQVIQQAFNEILDPLFKAKEDLAVEAAETKKLRDKHRSEFENIKLDDEKGAPRQRSQPASTQARSPRDQLLHELLATSGYSVDAAAFQAEQGADDDDEHSETSVEEEEDDDDDSLPALIPEDEPNVATDEDEPTVAPAEPSFYRDPTMPQFRPDSIPAAASHQRSSQFEPASSVPTAGPSHSSSKTKAKAKEEEIGGVGGEPVIPPPLPRETLEKWKRLDLAEVEAKARGGWGRLDFAEFEREYKACEAAGARMDYLGTWLDFCIPST